MSLWLCGLFFNTWASMQDYRVGIISLCKLGRLTLEVHEFLLPKSLVALKLRARFTWGEYVQKAGSWAWTPKNGFRMCEIFLGTCISITEHQVVSGPCSEEHWALDQNIAMDWIVTTKEDVSEYLSPRTCEYDLEIRSLQMQLRNSRWDYPGFRVLLNPVTGILLK
jgi:hypothetical protein